ncbi:transposase [Planomonospora sphaerica]|uniref:transposase n=1 Tax=Planomonospora sphaerica TaxID=161355 RepID=UPI000A027570
MRITPFTIGCRAAKLTLHYSARADQGSCSPMPSSRACSGHVGAPACQPGQLALVSVLQYAENLSDRQAADAVRGLIERKYTLGLELEDPSFDFSVLSGFRALLVAHSQEEHILELLLERWGSRAARFPSSNPWPIAPSSHWAKASSAVPVRRRQAKQTSEALRHR